MWREKDDLLRTVPCVGEQLSVTLLALPAGVGHAGSSAGRRLGGGCSLQPGQRHPAGQTNCLGRDGRECGPPSTWGHCPRPAATRSYETSITGCWPLVSRKKAAIVACTRKLLVTLNSMLRHRSTWRDMSPEVVGHSA